MLALSGAAGGALLTAFVITVTEMTEVVAIVYAMAAESGRVRPGLAGAALGVAAVAGVSVGVGFSLTEAQRVSELYTLLVGALILWAFALFLLRSTFKTYLRADRTKRGVPSTYRAASHAGLGPRALFSTGFSVGAIESLEACIVLLGLVAGGSAWEAVLGALLGGAVLFVIGLYLHASIRKVKVPLLKWVATSMLFTFAAFWTWEAAGESGLVPWSATVGGLPSDVLLLPLFAGAFVVVGLAVRARVLLDRGRRRGLPRAPEPH